MWAFVSARCCRNPDASSGVRRLLRHLRQGLRQDVLGVQDVSELVQEERSRIRHRHRRAPVCSRVRAAVLESGCPSGSSAILAARPCRSSTSSSCASARASSSPRRAASSGGMCVGDRCERSPDRAFPADAGREPLELEQPAQGRVPEHASVRLQARKLLGRPPHRELDVIHLALEGGHDREQLLAILCDLLGERAQVRPELGALVLRGGACGEVGARGGPRKMVVQVDRERVVREQRRRVHVSRFPSAAPRNASVPVPGTSVMCVFSLVLPIQEVRPDGAEGHCAQHPRRRPAGSAHIGGPHARCHSRIAESPRRCPYDHPHAVLLDPWRLARPPLPHPGSVGSRRLSPVRPRERRCAPPARVARRGGDRSPRSAATCRCSRQPSWTC